MSYLGTSWSSCFRYFLNPLFVHLLYVMYYIFRGIVPITCDELFKTMEQNDDPNRRYEVMFSMLEIYNEQVRDLLSKDNPKGGLNVRQNPKLGMFYVEGLKKVPVGSYAEIEKRMEQGI